MKRREAPGRSSEGRFVRIFAAAVLAVGAAGCGDQPGGVSGSRDAGEIDAARVARVLDSATGSELHDVAVRAASVIDRPIPAIATSPRGSAIVGVPVRYVDASSWRPVSETVTNGQVSLTVTAAVDRIVWSTGDGAVVTCTTPGDLGPAALDCRHIYTEPSVGRYLVTATTHWRATWTASTGETGSVELSPLTGMTSLRIGKPGKLAIADA